MKGINNGAGTVALEIIQLALLKLRAADCI